YTCSSCGATEQQTIPMTVSVDACDHSVEQEAIVDQGYTVTFAGDSGVDSVTVYSTQDYTGASESVSATGTTVSRSSDTGEPDSSGSGQVNFTIVLKDGYTLSQVTATSGTYKNIKELGDNTYRITKVSADTTITITTIQCVHGTIRSGTTPTWSWSDGYGTATLSYTCADCGNTVNVDGTVMSVLTSSSLITFTAKATIGSTEYTDTKTASPFTATFDCDEGVKSVNVYYTQDYTSADETGVTTAVARDSDSGYPVVTGDGQINFVVILKDGYTLDSVTASGAYKNVKSTSIENTYRITKVSGAVTISVATTKSETSGYILGDTDGDGEVTILDATWIQRVLVGIGAPADFNEAAADVDGDGDMTILDATFIQRYLVDIPVPYAIEEMVYN
ncbi:dockerin type I repeat-containing protein, partial [Ruminococcus sp.]|uniref:dockerin type I repeat-containing protein n=1 Tax=Ruminococcus sp. TaxID=41978 RepID=UPI00388F2A1D